MIALDQTVGDFPESRRARWSLRTVIPKGSLAHSQEILRKQVMYLSNQVPSIPRADRSPPVWIHSLRQRSSLLSTDQLSEHYSRL